MIYLRLAVKEMHPMAARNRQFFLIPLFILLCSFLGGIYGPGVTAENAPDEQKVRPGLEKISKVIRAVEEN